MCAVFFLTFLDVDKLGKILRLYWKKHILLARLPSLKVICQRSWSSRVSLCPPPNKHLYIFSNFWSYIFACLRCITFKLGYFTNFKQGALPSGVNRFSLKCTCPCQNLKNRTKVYLSRLGWCTICRVKSMSWVASQRTQQWSLALTQYTINWIMCTGLNEH